MSNLSKRGKQSIKQYGSFDFVKASSLNLTRSEKMLTLDEEIDVRGLNCPMPIIRTRQALKKLSTGQFLKVIATDPGTVRDFEVLCDVTGNELVESESINGEFIFIIKKAVENKQTINS